MKCPIEAKIGFTAIKLNAAQRKVLRAKILIFVNKHSVGI